MTWAARRIGAVCGACAILSARRAPVASAWAHVRTSGDARLSGGTSRARLEAHLRRQLLAAPQLAALAARLGDDPAQPTVIKLGRGDLDDGLLVLLERLELLLPFVLALRSQGRVAGLVMFCRSALAEAGSAESRRALRLVQPLVELSLDPDEVVSLTLHDLSEGLRDRGLTRREQSIALIAISGATNAEIAMRLGIAEATVKNHMVRVLRKCGVRSRAQLIALHPVDESGRTDL